MQPPASVLAYVGGDSGKTIVMSGTPWGPTTTESDDPTMTARHPRTGGGVSAEGYLVVAVIDGRSYGPGMTGTELAQLFIGFGTDRALMFDGGGSSAMHVTSRGIVNEPSDGSVRAVANQLVFTASEEWVDASWVR